jgi:hypothetical protein
MSVLCSTDSERRKVTEWKLTAKQIHEQSIFSPSSNTTPLTQFSSSTTIFPTLLLINTSNPRARTCSTTMPPASLSSCLDNTHLFLSISFTCPKSSRSIIALAASRPSSPPPTTAPVVPFLIFANSMSFCRSSIVRYTNTPLAS